MTSIDILSLNHQLIRLISHPTVGSKRKPGQAVKILKKLRDMPMVIEYLVQSKIGFTINHLRTLGWSDEVTQLAEELINSWKQLLADPQDIKRAKKKKALQKNLSNESINETIAENHRIETIAKKFSEREAKQSSESETEEPNQRSNVSSAFTFQTSSSNSYNKVLDVIDVSDSEDEIIIPRKRSVRIETDDGLQDEIPPKKKVLSRKRPVKSILKNKNIASKPKFNRILQSQYENRENHDPNKPLPPIGQLPEFSQEILRQRRLEREARLQGLNKDEEGNTMPFPLSPVKDGVDGNVMYEKIVRKRKLERTLRMDSPTKRAKTFTTVGIDRFRQKCDLSPTKVQNLPVPRTQPILTPADRIKIIQSRPTEESQPSTSTPIPYKDEFDLPSDTWRTRSAKVFGKVVPRKEHKPKWL